MSDPDRSARLQTFVDYVAKHIRGDEKGEAQVFLDRLFQGFGHGGVKEAGAELEERVKNDRGGTAFADLVWKPVVLIEMKRRGEDLSRHLQQAFDYWVHLVPGRPRWVVLCNFDEFWIYDFDVDLNEPQDIVRIEELPERYFPLNFLFPTREEPRFRVNREKVTREAADLLAMCFRSLRGRADVGRERAERFILQILVALFSEDIKLIPDNFVTDLLDEIETPPQSFDLLGGLFAEPTPVELQSEELTWLRKAAESHWAHVSPDIFGTIFQHAMVGKTRNAYGAHYTFPTDIMKIVQPTIVRPWMDAIESAQSPDQLRALRERLGRFRVLDPACGSGNFLYIAYRELKRIEYRIHERLDEMTGGGGQREFGVVSADQFYGIDILPFAVELAKVTMSLAHKLAIDELHITEKPLPLDNLDDNIVCRDALIRSELMGHDDPEQVAWRRPLLDDADKAVITPWPEADVIIGNPPFNGAKKLKPDLGPDYVNAVRKAYPGVPGMADYCVFWFRRAHDHVAPCTAADKFRGRVGLVGTQNIRNNKSRVGGLDHVVASGTIIEAVDNQP